MWKHVAIRRGGASPPRRVRARPRPSAAHDPPRAKGAPAATGLTSDRKERGGKEPPVKRGWEGGWGAREARRGPENNGARRGVQPPTTARPVIKEPGVAVAGRARLPVPGRAWAGASSVLAAGAQLSGYRELARGGQGQAPSARSACFRRRARPRPGPAPGRFANMLRVFKPTSPMSGRPPGCWPGLRARVAGAARGVRGDRESLPKAGDRPPRSAAGLARARPIATYTAGADLRHGGCRPGTRVYRDDCRTCSPARRPGAAGGPSALPRDRPGRRRKPARNLAVLGAARRAHRQAAADPPPGRPRDPLG